MSIEKISFKKASKNKVPQGAEILSKNVRVEVEEIQNGFIIEKNFDINYQFKGEKGYVYFSKKWFTKTNPISIDKKVETSLADKLS